MTNQGNDVIQFFLSNIDEIDFNTISIEKYQSLIEDEERRKKISSICFEEDQKRSIASGLLLQYCFHQWLKKNGIEDRIEFSTQKNQYGKPQIAGFATFHYNISHGGRYVVCAVGKSEIGVDVEAFVSHKDVLKLAKRFFTQEEYETICNVPDQKEKNVFFTRLWTMKESYIKYIGQGLGYGMNEFFAKDYKPNEMAFPKKVHCIVDYKSVTKENTPKICEYFCEPGVSISVCSHEGFPEKPETVSIVKLIEGKL